MQIFESHDTECHGNQSTPFSFKLDSVGLKRTNIYHEINLIMEAGDLTWTVLSYPASTAVSPGRVISEILM